VTDQPTQPTPDRPNFTPRPKLFWALLTTLLLWITAMWWMWVATRR
jgi:hypothetical protein